MEMKRNKIIYLIAYFLLNILMCYSLTSNLILKDLSPFPRDFFMYANSFFGDLGFFLVFFALALLIFKTDYARARFIMILSIIFGVLYLGISIYFQYYGMFFSFYNLATFSATGGGDALGFLLGSVWTLIKQANFIFFLSAILMIILFIFFFFKKRKDEVFRKSSLVSGVRRVYLGFGLLVFAILMMSSSLGAYKVNIDNTWYEDNATPLYGSQAVGLFNYYVYDAYSYYIAEKEGYSDDIIEEIRLKLEEYKVSDYLSPIDGITTKGDDYKNLYQGKNLLLIQVESLNDFVIGLKIKTGDEYLEVTPNLNQLVEKSVYFNNYYTTVGIGNTSDAEFTAMTGIYPRGYNYTVYEYANVDYQTLPKLFKEVGYKSFSAHANIGSFYDRSRLHPYLYGFDYHVAKEQFEYSDSDLIHTWINDEVFLKKTIDIMKEESKEGPVFAFAITISCHMPYHDPEERLTEASLFPGKENLFSEDIKLTRNTNLNEQLLGYLEHASYTDYALGEALKYLEETGLSDDTIVILYGDHGSGIDAFQMFYDNPDIFVNSINPLLEYQEEDIARKLEERRMLSRVPLLIFDPSGEDLIEPEKISLVRAHNSISRTVSNLFGLKPDYYFGVNALSPTKTLAYNPRNFDIFVDGLTISGQSLDFIIDEGYENIYNYDKMGEIVDAFRREKDFNDKLLKSEIFPKLQE